MSDVQTLAVPGRDAARAVRAEPGLRALAFAALMLAVLAAAASLIFIVTLPA